MDKKIERYYNYIVDDLIKKTEVDYEKRFIYYPYMYGNVIPLTMYLDIPFGIMNFKRYITTLYGVREEEHDIIWDMYSKKIKSLIKNE